MIPEKIIIRELEEKDLPDLVRFFSLVYRYKEPDVDFLLRFYKWKYLDNLRLYPNGAGSLAGISEGRIVAFIGAINYRISSKEGLKKAAWVADWMRDHQYAPAGLGTVLLKKLMSNKNGVAITCTELSSDGKKIFKKFDFISQKVGVHAYCHLNGRAISKSFSAKGLRLLISIFIQQINKLWPFKERLFFSKVVLNNMDIVPGNANGLKIDRDYLNWIAASPAFTGDFFNIMDDKKTIGNFIAQPFEKERKAYIRILDYHIPDKYFKGFLQTVKQFYRAADIIIIKHPRKMKLRSFLAGFYNSEALFWYPKELDEKFDFSQFSVSNLEKDTAFRGVNNII